MRSPEDLIKVGVVLSTVVSLDWERITEDPVWASIADNVNLSDPEQRQQALFLYLSSYLRREKLFDSIFMPSTNGPSNLEILSMEDLSNGNSISNNVGN